MNDKFTDIKQIVKILDIWVKERDYELIPIINLLNEKMNDVAKILEK